MVIKFKNSEELKRVLRESKDEEITYYTFFYEVKSVLKQLLTTPNNIVLSNFWGDIGVNKRKIINLLKKFRIIEADINLTDDKNVLVKYSVIKYDIKRNIRRLYIYLIENKKENIQETDCGGCMGAVGGVEGSYETKLGEIGPNLKEADCSSSIGDSTYSTPYFLNKNNKTYRFSNLPMYKGGKIVKINDTNVSGLRYE